MMPTLRTGEGLGVGSYNKNEKLLDVGGGVLGSILDVHYLFYFMKENEICARHHAEPNINILL